MAPSTRHASRLESTTGTNPQDATSISHQCVTSIYTSLSNLKANGKYSDMTICCGGREFKAHRAIVCAQSCYFDSALTTNLEGPTPQTIDLPDDDPDTLERFLEFLYTGTYSDNINLAQGRPSVVSHMAIERVQEKLRIPPGVIIKIETTSDDRPSTAQAQYRSDTEYEYESDASSQQPSDIQEPEEEDDRPDKRSASNVESNLHAEEAEDAQVLIETQNSLFVPLRLFIMAEKYEVPALRLLARDRFYRAAELVWAEAECFPDVVDELYRCTTPTDTSLREIVCRLVGNRIRESEIREKMRSVMAKHGDFAVGVMDYMIQISSSIWE